MDQHALQQRSKSARRARAEQQNHQGQDYDPIQQRSSGQRRYPSPRSTPLEQGGPLRIVGASEPVNWQIFPTKGGTPLPETSTIDDGQTVTTIFRGAEGTKGAKGCALWYARGVTKAVDALGCSWAYSWTPDVASQFDKGTPTSLELVPMITTNARTVAEASIPAGHSHVLGWNEPSEQQLPSADAAKAWPELYRSISNGGKTLVGSPAPANTNLRKGDWFYDFMAAIENKVDFIALHHYAPEFNNVTLAADNLKLYIQGVHNQYNKPIWLTEFAMVDYSVWPSFKVPSVDVQQQYLIASCNMLEMLVSQGIVQRYSWFAVPEHVVNKADPTSSDNQPPTYLIDSGGQITALGKLYQAVREKGSVIS